MNHSFETLQGSSQLTQLSLAKFSHTTTSIGHNGPLNWTHIIGNGDLVCTFEKHSTTGRVMLRVLREHSTLLEEIGLTHYAHEPANPNPSRQKPAFAVIVKLPCLAVKYPAGSAHLRRFQIKFSLDRDYYTALAILSEIHCPFSESSNGSAPPSRKLTSTSSFWNLAPVPARETTYSNYGPGSMGNPAPPEPVFPLQSTGARPVSSTIGPPHSPSPSPFSFASYNPARGNTQTNELQLSTESSQSTLSRPPTAAAAIACYDREALNQLLPPTRDLPFRQDAIQRRPHTAQRDHQALPLPSPSSSPSVLPVPPWETPPTDTDTGTDTTAPKSKICVLRVPIRQTESGNPTQTQTQQQSITPSDLSGYLSAPTEERIAVIENWIVEHIEDEGFLKLCQDVEGVWRRVALGK